MLDATVICSGRSAHRRFQEWTQAGVFQQLWAQGLLSYEEIAESLFTSYASIITLAVLLLWITLIIYNRSVSNR